MTTVVKESKKAPVAKAASASASAPAALSMLDRCDRCNSQAYVRVTMPVGELLFCGHHGRVHAPAYRQVATAIHDESEKLFTRINS